MERKANKRSKKTCAGRLKRQGRAAVLDATLDHPLRPRGWVGSRHTSRVMQNCASASAGVEDSKWGG